MQSYRTHIIILVITLLSTGLYFYRLLDLNMDALAAVCMACVSVAAMKDIRLLFVGWFLFAPYFVPLASADSANIASNFSHNYFIPVMTVAVLVYYFVKGKQLIWGKEDVLILIFIGYAVASSLYATEGRYDDLRNIYIIYLLPYCLYLIAKNIDIDSNVFKMLAFASLFHLVQAVLLSVYEFQSGSTLYQPDPKVDWVDVGSMRRISGSLGTPIVLGVFLQVLFGFIYLAYRYGLVSRLVFRSSIPFLMLLNLLTFTRSVWLGAIVMFIYLMYKTSEDVGAKLMRVAGFVALSVVIVGVVVAVSPDVQKRISGEENANFRIVMAQASLNMIADSPIVGWGMGTFDDFSDRYLFDARGVYIVKDTSHVTVLTILAELGILGTIPFLLFIYFNIRPQGIRFKELPAEDRLIVAVIVGTLISFGVNAFLIDMRFYSLAYSWLFVSLGFICNIYHENRQLKEQRV